MDFITAELVDINKSQSRTRSRSTAHGINGKYHLRNLPAAPGNRCNGDVRTSQFEIASVNGRPSFTNVYNTGGVGPNSRASRSSTHSPPRMPTSQSCAS